MYEENCTSDLQFNPTSRTCDLPERVNCIVMMISLCYYFLLFIIFYSIARKYTNLARRNNTNPAHGNDE